MDPKALFNLSYGMYIVGSRRGEKLNAQVANAVMQLTGDPITMAVCLNKQNFTEECLLSHGAFSVSVLEEDVPMTFIGQFGFKSGRDIDKFEGVNYATGSLDVPVVKDWCLSGFEAKIIDRIEVHTHVLFVGEVVSSEVFKQGIPLTYANYHLVKKGKSPKTAPT
ncbi:flavin reductase family protein, partial [Synergistaceae bacterium OttesenSCG-928-I11]|nr:flavin reductase family protein [Synergistaceae bacterium OttesenSCG-928-I11]